jgi:triosephosphate isomerase (TIM)
MRRPIVVGNWKMHGSRAENARLIEELGAQYPPDPAADCVVCPPFVYLQEVGRLLRDTPMRLGAQDLCADTQGAFTGEVSAAMLKDVGCEYAIVGHSERRLLYRESDQQVARKFAAAHSKALIPILCVGEQLSDREAGRTAEVVQRQLDVVLELCGAETLGHGVVAYEPVWAIGTGRNATGAMVAEMVADIREALSRFWPARHRSASILYGGSVTPENIEDLGANGRIDGYLVGGASLDCIKFSMICEGVAQLRPA